MSDTGELGLMHHSGLFWKCRLNLCPRHGRHSSLLTWKLACSVERLDGSQDMFNRHALRAWGPLLSFDPHTDSEVAFVFSCPLCCQCSILLHYHGLSSPQIAGIFTGNYKQQKRRTDLVVSTMAARIRTLISHYKVGWNLETYPQTLWLYLASSWKR